MWGERRQVLKSKPTADVDIVRAKLRLVQEQLDHLRGGGGGERGGGGGCDGGGEVGAGAMAGESNAVRVGDVDDGGDGEGGGVGVVVDTRASPACITAGLAAELGRSNSSLHVCFFPFPTARGQQKIPLQC